MAYDYPGGGENLGSEYNSFDDSARFDSSRLDSARFDSSFRAPNDFKADHFGVEESKEGFHDFKSAANGYEHPAPIYENEEMGSQTPGMPSLYMNFGSESPSGFSQREYSAPAYTGPEYSPSVNEGSLNKELDEDVFVGGAVLPPPEEMQEEGQLRREWRRQNAIRLQEKERIESEKLQQIMDDADDYKDNHKAKRHTNREAQMKNNRDKERVFLADQEHFHKNADKAYWKAVAELVPKELPASLEPKSRQLKEKKEKKSTFVALPGPKPGKPTDMGRMRQVLLKLKHNPPAHMIPPPPPPPKPEAKPAQEGVKAENGGADEKATEGEKPAEGAAALPAEPEAPSTPELVEPIAAA